MNLTATPPKGAYNEASARALNISSSLVILTLDLLTHEVDCFMPLSCGPLVSMCVKVGLFVFIALQHTDARY